MSCSSPIITRSPGCSLHRPTRAPLTMVPLVESRSCRIQLPSRKLRRACRRETAGPDRTMSQTGLRPITSSSWPPFQSSASRTWELFVARLSGNRTLRPIARICSPIEAGERRCFRAERSPISRAHRRRQRQGRAHPPRRPRRAPGLRPSWAGRRGAPVVAAAAVVDASPETIDLVERLLRVKYGWEFGGVRLLQRVERLRRRSSTPRPRAVLRLTPV